MKLNFTFKHLDRSEALETYTAEQLEHISRFLLKNGLGQVLFSKKNHEFGVEVSVNTKERYFRANASDTDPYQAVDQVMEKLEKQFLKTKKLVQHYKSKTLSKEGKLDRMNERFETRFRFRKAA